MNTATAENHKNPFPGLRPFEEDEEYLFFGRENQVDAMVDKLAATRFLAVVGTSGSGKSSLVNCGLRPALHGGLMARAGTAWRMAQFRPGSDPMRAMARALAKDGVLFRDYQAGGLTLAEIVDTTLRMSKLGLIDIYEQARLGEDVNLLVVVDQFEELFRYRQFGAGHQENVYGMSEEAAAFVNLLLEARAQTTYPIYVVLTMRSDFLGDCTQFPGLAETINAGQYLVPRMARDERRAAISGPVGVGGSEISPVLLTRLVNDVGDNPDQLSILQHSLNRTWNQWERSGGNGPLDLPHYEAIGTMAHALDQHAERAYAELATARQQQICEKLFKALTDKATDPRGVRRPSKLGTLCALAEATPDEVTQVIDVFRKPSRSFLMPPAGDTLAAETVIDISHESLMRVWEQLKTWADKEAQSAHTYTRLAETAVLHREGGAGLWRDPDLQIALTWREESKPNETWAQRYHSEFALAMRFLDESVAERDAEFNRRETQRKRAIRRTRLTAGVFAVLFLLALGALIFAFLKARQARSALSVSRRLRYVANMNLAQQDLMTGNLARVVQLLNIDFPEAGQDDVRSFLWYDLWHNSHREMATLRGHSSSVDSAAFSPDGKTLASASEDNTVRLWDVRTRRELATLSGHSDFVRAVAFSPDGKTLASGSEDKTVKLWDVGMKSLRETLPQQSGGVIAVAFSPDGKTLAWTCGDLSVKLWDLERKAPASALTGEGHSQGVLSVAFSPDGKMLASGSNDKTVKLWNLTTKSLTATLPVQSGGILSVAFSPDGKMLAWSSNDKILKLWPIGSPTELATIKLHSDAYSVAFSPDGKTLAATGLDGTVKLWDTGTQKETAVLSGHSLGVLSVAFSPDGRTLASASRDGTVKLSDSAAGLESPTLIEDSQKVFSVAFSPDGKTLATASVSDKKPPEAGTVEVWDAGTRKELKLFPLAQAKFADSVAFAPDGKTLAAAISDGTVKLWDTSTWQELTPFKGQHTQQVNSVAFSPDGKTLASASNDWTVKLWDIRTGQEMATLKHEHSVVSVAFSPDGKTLAAATYDMKVKLWDTGTRQELATLKGHLRAVLSVAFSPDGKTLASGDYTGAVKLWDLETREELKTLMGNSGGVLSIAFSPDGKTLASGGFDNAVMLWDTRTQEELATLTGHLHGVYSLAFSPDGRTLASGSFDKTVRFWIDATDDEVERSRK